MPGVVQLVGLRFASGLLVMALLVASASGQQVQIQDRAALLRSSPPSSAEPYSDENGVRDGRAVESPNDADIGEQEILKRVERYEPFTASVATPFYYTSNVALVNGGEQGDVLFAPAVGVAYAPH